MGELVGYLDEEPSTPEAEALSARPRSVVEKCPANRQRDSTESGFASVQGLVVGNKNKKMQAETKEKGSEPGATEVKSSQCEKPADAESKKGKQRAEATRSANGEKPSNTKPETRNEGVATKSEAKKAGDAKGDVADFIPANTFGGKKPGMVFKKGAKGVGYYKDTYVPPPATSTKRKADGTPAGGPEPKKGVVSGPGGLKYEVMKTAPQSAAKANRGRQVQVRYEGRLASNGRRFDKGMIKFRLGGGEVIKGWDVGVDGMRVGEKRRLLIPASLGYGARGAPPDIPPNAALTFDVELVKV